MVKKNFRVIDALKKLDQFMMNTGGFWGWGVYAIKKPASAGSSFTPILNTFYSFSYRSGHDIFLNNSELHLVNDVHFEPSSTNVVSKKSALKNKTVSY